ncbi:MAG: hypothetical protein ACTSVZ_06595 [Promethearchaeota archaeon]
MEAFRQSLGHLYRAGYDVLDWLAITFRELISKALRFYSNKTIEKVFPNYYSKIKPKIEDISYKIAEIRENKDVDNDDHFGENAFTNFMEYYKLVSDVEQLYKNTIRNKIGALKEHRTKSVFYSVGKIIVGFVLGVLTGFLTC